VLLDQGVTVVEVDRPDRRARRQRGPVGPDRCRGRRPDRAGWGRDHGPQAARWDRGVDLGLCTARSGAVKARTAAINQLKGLLVTAPASLREALGGRSTPALVGACARLRPDQTALADPVQGCKAALVVVAQRIQLLEAEITLADQQLATLVGRAAPRLLQLLAIGVDHAGQLLTTAGQHPERLRGEAAFAHLCGVAPSLPAPARPAGTGSIVTPTAPCTWPWWSGCGSVPAPAPMSNGGPRKACPNPRSSAASSATWPARSTTPWSPTSTPSTPLDGLYEHPGCWSSGAQTTLLQIYGTGSH
jgi:hypothetical protein